MHVILRPCFGRRISRDATDLKTLARLLGPYCRVPGGKATLAAIKSSISQEILRATEALQDDIP
jgi:hypothetical protein